MHRSKTQEEIRSKFSKFSSLKKLKKAKEYRMRNPHRKGKMVQTKFTFIKGTNKKNETLSKVDDKEKQYRKVGFSID